MYRDNSRFDVFLDLTKEMLLKIIPEIKFYAGGVIFSESSLGNKFFIGTRLKCADFLEQIRNLNDWLTSLDDQRGDLLDEAFTFGSRQPVDVPASVPLCLRTAETRAVMILMRTPSALTTAEVSFLLRAIFTLLICDSTLTPRNYGAPVLSF